MEIKTIDNSIIDTNKESDVNAEMIELMEKSGIRELAIKYDGLCYMMCALPKSRVWNIMHLNTPEKIDFFLLMINDFIKRIYKNKYRMVIVPNEENEGNIEK